MIEGRSAPERVPTALAPVEAWLRELTGDDADCLRARFVGQVAHAHNRAGHFAIGQALHLALPDEPATAPVARARRSNGLAYAS